MSELKLRPPKKCAFSATCSRLIQIATGDSLTLASDEKGLARYRQPRSNTSSSVWLSLATSSRRHRMRSRMAVSNSHFDLLRLGFLALRKAQRQHTILIIGLDGFRFHGVGQREAAAEGAIGAFDAQIVVFVHVLLKLAFAANGEDVVLHADVQVLRIHVRQVGLDDQFILGLIDVDGRSPRGQVRLLARTSHHIAKYAIDLFLQSRSPAEWLFPAIHSSHVRYLPND